LRSLVALRDKTRLTLSGAAPVRGKTRKRGRGVRGRNAIAARLNRFAKDSRAENCRVCCVGNSKSTRSGLGSGKPISNGKLFYQSVSPVSRSKRAKTVSVYPGIFDSIHRNGPSNVMDAEAGRLPGSGRTNASGVAGERGRCVALLSKAGREWDSGLYRAR